MGAVLFLLLFVAVVLACTPSSERRFAVGSMLVVGAVIWLAVRINLHRIVGNLVGDGMALAWDYRNDLLLIFAASIVLVVPAVMIYVAITDQFRRRAAERARRRPKGLGFPLRSQHPWLWVMDEKGSANSSSRFSKKG